MKELDLCDRPGVEKWRASQKAVPWAVTIATLLCGTAERWMHTQQETEQAKIRMEIGLAREASCQDQLTTMWEALYRP